VTKTSTCSPIPPDTYSLLGSNHYRVVETPTNFYLARADCQSDGGQLVTFKTEQEFEDLKPLFGE